MSYVIVYLVLMLLTVLACRQADAMDFRRLLNDAISRAEAAGRTPVHESKAHRATAAEIQQSKRLLAELTSELEKSQGRLIELEKFSPLVDLAGEIKRFQSERDIANRDRDEAQRALDAMVGNVRTVASETIASGEIYSGAVAFDDDLVAIKDSTVSVQRQVRQMVRDGGAFDYRNPKAGRRPAEEAFLLGHLSSLLERAKRASARQAEATLIVGFRNEIAAVNLFTRENLGFTISEPYLKALEQQLLLAVQRQHVREIASQEQRRAREEARDERIAARQQQEVAAKLEAAETQEQEIARRLTEMQSALTAASVAQRAALADTVAALKRDLDDAKQGTQRARSMAEQTRNGYVYIISNIGSFGDRVVKIGQTRRLDPRERIRELSDASVPFVFDIHALIPTEDAPGLEAALHKKYIDHRVNKINFRREFFHVPIEQVQSDLEAMGHKVEWVKEAAGREYRLTRGIESGLAENTPEAQAWRARQLSALDSLPQRAALLDKESRAREEIQNLDELSEMGEVGALVVDALHAESASPVGSP